MRFTIHSLVILAPLLVAWFMIVHRRRATGQLWWSREQFLARTAFVLYVAAVINATLFPVHVHTGEARQRAEFHQSVNIVPFRDFDVTDFVLNIMMTVLLGIALVVFWPRQASVVMGLFIGYCLGAAIELLQLLGRVTIANDRYVSINDIIANALGVAVGVVVVRIFTRNPRMQLQLEWLRGVD